MSWSRAQSAQKYSVKIYNFARVELKMSALYAGTQKEIFKLYVKVKLKVKL